MYGIKKGNQKSNGFTPEKNQYDLAGEFGITKANLHNYKKLQLLIPELQDLVEEGKLSMSTAF